MGRNPPYHSVKQFIGGRWLRFNTRKRKARMAVWAESSNAAPTQNYFAYNFIKIHRTLRMSPAMPAGVTDRPWSVEDLFTLREAYEQRRVEREAYSDR
jgi:hypothetical protein